MSKYNNIRISTDSIEDGLFAIYIDNIGVKHSEIKKCVDIIRKFTKGDTLFFGFYRLDGMRLTSKQWEKLEKEIPEFFRNYGRYELVTETVEHMGKIKIYPDFLTIGSLPANNSTYAMIPWAFEYYLESTIFCPNIKWEKFIHLYSNYMKYQTREYILNGYADFLFTYADSGDFTIYFNSNLYDRNEVYEDVLKILNV